MYCPHAVFSPKALDCHIGSVCLNPDVEMGSERHVGGRIDFCIPNIKHEIVVDFSNVIHLTVFNIDFLQGARTSC